MKGKSLFLVAAFAATTIQSLPLYAESLLSLEQRINQLEQQNQTRNQLQSEMSMQLIELKKEVKELIGITEEQQFKLQQIQERQRDLYRDIENRFSGIPQGGQPIADTETPAVPDQNLPVISSNIADQVKQAVVTGDDRAEFEAAFKLVRNKQYAKAITSFEAFLQKYPNGSYSDNARFWIGQVYFAQSQFAEAEKQFISMRTEFPESSKLPAAIIKLAEIKTKQEKWQEAKALYNEVITNYTGSPQQLARKGLKDIKQSGH